MAFDEDPRDSIESYPCSSDCPDGSITFNADSGMWECDTCEFETAGCENGMM
jgi:ribosomal protein L37AE/L43A